jgi:hypothetical protein
MADLDAKAIVGAIHVLDSISEYQNEHLLVTSQTNSLLFITIKGKYTNIDALVEIKSARTQFPQVYPPLVKVLRPRLALGRNVSFGGLVTYEQLNQLGGMIESSHILKYVLYALYNKYPIQFIPLNTPKRNSYLHNKKWNGDLTYKNVW